MKGVEAHAHLRGGEGSCCWHHPVRGCGLKWRCLMERAGEGREMRRVPVVGLTQETQLDARQLQ